MTQSRYYSSTAVKTTLSLSIDAAATQIQVASDSGFPAQFPFTLILEKDTANEEIVTATALVGANYTITRGVDGTSAKSHAIGATCEHGVSALDFTDFRLHEGGVGGAHGVGAGSVVVGTQTAQTISNKTLGSNLNANSFQVTGLGTPTNSADASTKGYVDAVIATGAANAAAAASSASAAASSAASASVSAQNTASLYDQFDDRYLGTKGSNPAVDNDGNPLLVGALYFSSLENVMKVYTGSTWNTVAPDTAAFVSKVMYPDKGSILIGVASSSPVALPVGTANQMLITDSSAPHGITWQNVNVIFALTFYGFKIEEDGDLVITYDQGSGSYNVNDYDEWTILNAEANIAINANGELVFS